MCVSSVVLVCWCWAVARLTENKPLKEGDDICTDTDMAPALWPNTMTRSGSPPKAPMFSCTHCKASLGLGFCRRGEFGVSALLAWSNSTLG